MMSKTQKYTLCTVTIVALLFMSTAFLLYSVYNSATTIYETPWGKMNIDTARVAMIDYYASGKPKICYVVHMDIVQKPDSMLKVSAGDTVWYCLTPPGVRYYMVKAGETKDFQVWEWCKYNNVSWPNVTKYFKQEQIFVRQR